MLETVTRLNPIFLASSLADEPNKVGFTQKGYTENKICNLQVKWIFDTINKAYTRVKSLPDFSEAMLKPISFLDLSLA